MSCGKFVFPSHYLPLPILDVPSPVVNSSSHLITCHFPSWTSISCGKFVFPSHYLRLPILDVPSPVVTSSSHLTDLPLFDLGRLISCGKFVFPSHYLRLPILDVPSHCGRLLSSHLITCHFSSWKSHVMW